MENIEILKCTGGLLTIRLVGWIVIRIEDALIGGFGLRVLLFNREVLAQGKPVGRGSFMGCLHQGEFPFDRRGALERSASPDRPSHFAGHRFDLFILTNGGLNPIGFQMGIEGFGMLFDQIRALLVRVVRAGAKKQAETKRHPIAPQHRVVTSHASTPFERDDRGPHPTLSILKIRPSCQRD